MPGVSFSCPKCGKTLKSPQPIAAGKKIKCPTCAAVFAMPAREDEEDEIQDKPRAKKRAVVAPDGDEEDDDDDRPRGKKGRKSGGKGLLIGGIILLVVLLLGGGVVGAYFLWFAGVNRGGGEEDPLAYVPANSDAVVGIDQAALMNDKDVKPLIEQLLAEPDLKTNMTLDMTLALIDKMASATGLQRSELAAQVVMATKSEDVQGAGMAGGGMPAGGGRPGGGGGGMPDGNFRPGNAPKVSFLKPMTLILRSSKPFDQKKIAKSFSDSAKKTAHGKIYYSLPGSTFQTLFMPSNRTLILTTFPDSDVDALFNSDGKGSNLSGDATTLIQSVNKNTIWGAVLLQGQTKTQLQAAAGFLVPPDFKPVVDPILKGNGAAFAASLEGDQVKLAVHVSCADAASASQLAQTADNLWKSKLQAAANDKVAQGAGEAPKIVKMLTEAGNNVKVSADGSIAKVTTSTSHASFADAVAEAQRLDAQEKQAKAAAGADNSKVNPGGRNPGGGGRNPGGRGGKPGTP